METKTPPSVTSSYHHQRAPRTPESYFNVPESVALLNIVKSERIQSAFQSNRKNHASVWEMVAEVLNRFSARKRTAKQCCNRYENLKKIYTQLKKNPERHVRRNWPYMFLFKEIEEQRGECWGSNGKRLALISKNHNELSYYQRRRQAAELGVLLNKDNLTPHQHSLLQSLAHSTDSSQSGASKLERFLPNHFVEAQLNDGPPCGGVITGTGGGVGGGGGNIGGTVGVDLPYDDNPLQRAVVAAAAAAALAAQKRQEMQLGSDTNGGAGGSSGGCVGGVGGGGGVGIGINSNNNNNNNNNLPSPSRLCMSVCDDEVHNAATFKKHNLDDAPEVVDYEKDCNGALNLHNNDNNISMKSEPLSEGEFNPDDIQLMQTNYNGSQNFYSPSIDPNILHPDVIVDTDNLTDCTSTGSIKSGGGGGGVGGGKRKLSTSTDGDSTNYELIEYLKRREKRDEELLKRMDAREERFMNLLERTVIAIETLAASRAPNHQISPSNNNNNIQSKCNDLAEAPLTPSGPTSTPLPSPTPASTPIVVLTDEPTETIACPTDTTTTTANGQANQTLN